MVLGVGVVARYLVIVMALVLVTAVLVARLGLSKDTAVTNMY